MDGFPHVLFKSVPKHPFPVFQSEFLVSTSNDGHHLIITSEALDESCVAVIDIQSTQQNSDLVCGKGQLLCSRKALSYNKEFFVCDQDDGVVKVFDAKGMYQWEIGEDLECP